jgi:hypothetical protein
MFPRASLRASGNSGYTYMTIQIMVLIVSCICLEIIMNKNEYTNIHGYCDMNKTHLYFTNGPMLMDMYSYYSRSLALSIVSTLLKSE